MMSLLDYANDVNISIEEVKKLCDKLGIKYDSDDYMLSDTEITELDNSLSTSGEETALSEEEQEEDIEYDLVGYIPVDELIKAEQA